VETPAVRRVASKPAAGALRLTASQGAGRRALQPAGDGAGIDRPRRRRQACETSVLSLSRYSTVALVGGSLGGQEGRRLLF